MTGILLVDKPSGMTSHDVVDRVRKASGIRRVGHTGTLDPNATGLLVLCLGKATRLSEHLTGLDKVYEGTMRLGVVTAAAVVAHEIPQEVGDYIVLLNAGFSRSRALVYNALSGLAAVAGGVLGYFVIAPWQSYFPYLLVVAASSFIYVAVADLLPQLQQRLNVRDTLAQVAWLALGLALVMVAGHYLHSH